MKSDPLEQHISVYLICEFLPPPPAITMVIHNSLSIFPPARILFWTNLVTIGLAIWISVSYHVTPVVWQIDIAINTFIKPSRCAENISSLPTMHSVSFFLLFLCVETIYNQGKNLFDHLSFFSSIHPFTALELNFWLIVSWNHYLKHGIPPYHPLFQCCTQWWWFSVQSNRS